MGKNNKIDYSIGLDIGNTSVGWAVVDEKYGLLKKDNKHMWGSRLFEDAKSAAERRGFRSARRRYNKRRERIRLLQTFFEEKITKYDQTFFIRLSHTSFLDEEDKKKYLRDDFQNNYNLFIDRDLNDQDFYNKFPTIYHLRKHLCESDEKEDLRFIYLALHHIVKYRGNFLYEGQSFNLDNGKIEDWLDEVLENVYKYNDYEYQEDETISNQIIDILKKDEQRRLKVEDILKIINPEKKQKAIFKELFNAIVGSKFKVNKLLSKAEFEKEIDLQFSKADYDEKLTEAEGTLGEYIELINEIHNIYSWVELQGILGETDGTDLSISSAMVKRFKQHHADLVLLKKVIKEDVPDKYNDVFRNKNLKLHNYVNYIHHAKETPIEEFYKYIQKIIKDVHTDDADEIRKRISIEKFMLKQNDRTNGAVPYQMQLDEMTKILNHQKKYYPFLEENYHKIISILTFRIPYYFGPLKNNHDDFSWIIKKEKYENERILPWNYETVVDEEKTADEFIKRMRSYCTYFPNEPVLPKNSLTVAKFEVLNELNKIRVNGHLIEPRIKKQMLNTLFMKRKSVTDKALKKWFKDNQIFLNNENLEITGYQKNDAFSTSLSPWIDFTKIMGDINDDNYGLIEEIIYDLTVFEDHKILKKRLKGYNLNENQIRKIMKLRYTGWSRLSKKLLDGIKVSDRYGKLGHKKYIYEGLTVLGVLEETNMNLMEIINDDDLGFNKQIREASVHPQIGKFKYEEVRDLAGSPAIKRGIWQSLLIVDEIVKYMKHKPKNVFIEFAREEGKKQRTTSALQRLKAIYDDLDLQSKEDKNVYRELKSQDDSKKIDTERLQLYFMQKGRSMYSGTPLDIDKLDTYQIDHIVPQSLIKDDSIDNKVLVLQKENQFKLDSDVVPFEIRNKMSAFWKQLFDVKLISPKKYFALMRSEYSEKDKERFINRQLVETRQIIKNVAQIINNHYTDTHVVTVRANLSHDFRTKYHIYKNRDINDYHHAHDAYIACILGTYILQRYPKLDAKYVYDQYKKFSKAHKKDWKDAKDGFILRSMDYIYANDETGEVMWNPEWIGKIKKCFYYKDCFVTKKLEQKNGLLFNLTVLPNDYHSEKDITEATVPVNKTRSDVHKYGGFKGLQYDTCAIEGKDKKGKTVRKLAGIPIYLRNAGSEEKIKVITQKENLTDVRIVKSNIMKHQLVEFKGGIFYITSYQEFVNARQLVLNENQCRIINVIYNALSTSDYSLVDNSEVNELYKQLIDKMATLYSLYNGIAEKFTKFSEQFGNISIEEKCKVIRQMLIIMHSGPQNGEIAFDDFKIGSRIGRIKRKSVNLDDCTFISDSPTGLYSKKYKL